MTARTFPGPSGGALGPGFFPMVLSGLMILFSVLLLFSLRKEKSEPIHLFAQKNAVVFVSLLATIVYIYMITILGFLLATGIYLFGLMFYYKVGLIKNVMISVLVTAAIHGVFTQFLMVQLPRGILF